MGTRAVYATKPREQIATVLKETPRFLSAAEIYRALEAKKARVSLSTVYRTLEHLISKGEVTVRIDDAGESTYMLCGEPAHHHHHAICSLCGRVEDVDCDALGQFAEGLRARSGFQLDAHKMEFIGRCSACL